MRRIVLLALLLSLLPFATAAAQTQPRGPMHDRLAERRRINIERFRAYVESEIYPRNRTTPGLASVLIDDEDRFCAVANLMRQDGLETVLREQSRIRNDIRLASVTSGPLYEWILGSGFTREEIDRIQKPFMEVPRTDDRLQARRDDREKRRLRRLYRRILSELERHTERSLAIARSRLAASASGPVLTQVVPPSPRVGVSMRAPRARQRG